jgi:hypothetical protein
VQREEIIDAMACVAQHVLGRKVVEFARILHEVTRLPFSEIFRSRVGFVLTRFRLPEASAVRSRFTF